MIAACINETGPPSVIQARELPTPEPGPGQVRVKVAAAAVNPIDLYIRAGTIPTPHPFPYVVGCDLAGTVDAVGPGVVSVGPGDRVWASNQGLLGRQGCTAQFACVDESWLHRTPGGLTDQQAAAGALVGITAHLGLFECAKLRANETVFITGGSGGVGTMAIQLAKAAGARVATTASNEEKAALCRSLGADLVINYRTQKIADMLPAFSDGGVDVWLETQREPDLDLIVPLLCKRGRLVVMAGRTARPVLPLGAFYTRNASIHGFAMFNFSAEEQRPAAQTLNRLAESGAMRVVIAKAFPIAKTAEAHQFLEESTLGGAGMVVGKVVIEC